MSAVFEAINNPTRRRILDLLLDHPHSVGDLVEAMDISQPGVSKQLRQLREAGLVKVRQEAQRRWYYLNADPLQEVDEWLQDYRKHWEENLDRLEDYLRQLQKEQFE